MGKTSWQVKAKYNAKVYSRLAVDIPKELREKYKEKCDELGVSMRSQTIKLIEKFLQEEQ